MQLYYRIECDSKARERLYRNPLKGVLAEQPCPVNKFKRWCEQMIQGHNMNAIGVQPADFVVAPEVTSFDLSEFTRAEEMACIGETITNAAAEELHRMLEKLDSKLFGE